MIDVLYSLVDVHERFDHLILNSFYIRNLNMVSVTFESYFDRIFSIDKRVLDRICKKVLPRIHEQVHELTVEQYSMKRILHAVNYPQLNSLSLINCRADRLFQYLTVVRDLLAQQITNLTIDIENTPPIKEYTVLSDIFALILSLCKRLTDLNFCQFYHYRSLPICICYDATLTRYVSSTLAKLQISVLGFDNCLYLLDGRFDCLSTLIIHVHKILTPSSIIDNTKKLPKLKYFSLTSVEYTLQYDNAIIPLLRRMINLEELTLFLSVIRLDSPYIDGIQLHNQILIYMPHLNKLTFNINTAVANVNARINLSSNEDIKRSFVERRYGQVGSYVHTSSTGIEGGMFDKVLYLVMTDVDPFEHELFKIISQDFSLLKHLRIENDQPQKNKQHSSTLIIFPHLILLNLFLAHVDYAEQFLYDRNTYIPRLLNLGIEYDSLVMVTNNFNNNGARLNCAKLKRLNLDESFVRPENFHQYFPLL
ncbi:unnamed protein product [Rotaria sp. Silwood2]|nr:unnamed protein product [Rotaria sp. Silwood2]CAF4377618.1 unnamed protein product [Rotaria sp. Silwood2]